MDKLFSLKIPSDMSNYTEYHSLYRKLYVKTLIIIGMPISAFFSLYHWYQSRTVESVIVLSMFLALCFFLYDFKKKSETRSPDLFQEIIIRMFLFSFLFYLLYAVGIEQSMSKTPWFLIFSVLIFFSINIKEALIWSCSIAAILIYFLFYTELRTNPDELFNLKMRLLLIFGVLAGIAFIASVIMRSAIQNLFDKQTETQAINMRLKKEIEERKQIEKDLLQSEEKFRAFVESSSDWIWEVDPQGVYTYSSPKVEGILGYKPEEVVGGTPFDLMPSEEAERITNIFKDAVNQGATISALENQSIHKDGHMVILETSGVPVFDTEGQVVFFRGMDRDITNRKMVEKALQASNETLLTILNSIDATIFVADMQTHEIIFNNESMIKTYGKDMTGSVCYDVYRKNSEQCMDCTNDQLIDKKGKPTGVVVWQAENPIIKKWYINYDRAIEWIDGRLVRIQIAADITHLKEVEKQLQLAQKFEAIGTLAGGIAHQFNNALFGISGNLQLLEMDFPNNKKIEAYIRKMKRSAKRMVQLTNQLLAYARGGRYQAKIISLMDLIEETLPLVKHSIDPGIDISTRLPDNLFKIKADLTQVQMVFSAVLENAGEALEKKGRIDIVCQNITIDHDRAHELVYIKTGPYVCLTVTDTGKGMDKDTLSRIFEPFFTTKFEGRGLGLAAAFGIVKNHAGWISVDSILSKGTTVKIYLPAIETPAAKEFRQQPVEWIRGHGTILLIDDDEAVLTVCREMLKRLGYRVLVARTGQEAIDIVKNHDGDIDLAMLDILLPDMNGTSVYPILMEARPDLRVIVSSGYSIDGPAQKILDAGAQDFVQKPFTMKNLSEKLNLLIKGSP